ncbi:hypothetical protein GCM10023194_26510 [Planotetraspora phitsanulokensis]|uniref:Uncharacterized protein n=1 Tax=Planotetraspora phitsanulokensis TaxID=575192 RepID=A0A8J3UAW3_9ACTN|nr:hypothetical protein [Planotetraspora phitsanulokensis]GII41998.1 hypothetical protein Pph01_70010 [Planotetraspora phitsanulokensis]
MTKTTKAGRFEGKHQHGFSPDVGKASAEVVRAGDLAFRKPSADQGPGREVSDIERRGVPATDVNASSPLGVGVSTTTRAEDFAHKKESAYHRAGTHEKTGRPYGGPAQGHGTGVGRPHLVHDENT